MGYLNKHHTDLLTTFAAAFTDLGRIQAKKNAFSGGSYKIKEARLVGLDSDNIELEVAIAIRNRPEPDIEQVSFSLDADPIDAKKRAFPSLPPVPRSPNPVDDVVRRMNRLCQIVKEPDVSGKLIQLGIQIGGEGVGEIREDLYLNQVPHNRYVRKYFYEMAAEAALEAVILCSDKKISNRMRMEVMFPELNPSMDSYRYATSCSLTTRIFAVLPAI